MSDSSNSSKQTPGPSPLHVSIKILIHKKDEESRPYWSISVYEKPNRTSFPHEEISSPSNHATDRNEFGDIKTEKNTSTEEPKKFSIPILIPERIMSIFSALADECGEDHALKAVSPRATSIKIRVSILNINFNDHLFSIVAKTILEILSICFYNLKILELNETPVNEEIWNIFKYLNLKQLHIKNCIGSFSDLSDQTSQFSLEHMTNLEELEISATNFHLSLLCPKNLVRLIVRCLGHPLGQSPDLQSQDKFVLFLIAMDSKKIEHVDITLCPGYYGRLTYSFPDDKCLKFFKCDAPSDRVFIHKFDRLSFPELVEIQVPSRNFTLSMVSSPMSQLLSVLKARRPRLNIVYLEDLSKNDTS